MIAPIRIEYPPDRSFVDTIHCVGRTTELSEYPFACRMFVRFILLPARAITGKRCIGLTNYAFFRWKYSEIHLQNACTSFDCAVEESRLPNYFHIPLPVDDPLPHKATIFGKHSFPLSKSRAKYLARKPDVEQIPREKLERLDSKLSNCLRKLWATYERCKAKFNQVFPHG
jgi:hypothetical protein